jgi:hypothetical protein
VEDEKAPGNRLFHIVHLSAEGFVGGGAAEGLQGSSCCWPWSPASFRLLFNHLRVYRCCQSGRGRLSVVQDRRVVHMQVMLVGGGCICQAVPAWSQLVTAVNNALPAQPAACVPIS